MSGLVKRFDSSDPRRPETVRAWKARAGNDTYAMLSSGSGMALGAGAMFTKVPALAFLALAVSVAGLLNSPDIRKKESNTSPWTGVMMAITAVLNAVLAKITNNEISPAMAAKQAAMAANAASASLTSIATQAGATIASVSASLQ